MATSDPHADSAQATSRMALDGHTYGTYLIDGREFPVTGLRLAHGKLWFEIRIHGPITIRADSVEELRCPDDTPVATVTDMRLLAGLAETRSDAFWLGIGDYTDISVDLLMTWDRTPVKRIVKTIG